MQSVVYLCADADKTLVNAALAAFYGDPIGAQNLSRKLSADGQLPASHWGGAIAVTAERATVLKDWPDGTLPTPATDWSVHGLTEEQALDAGSKMAVQVKCAPAEQFDNVPWKNFQALIVSEGLQMIQDPIEP